MNDYNCVEAYNFKEYYQFLCKNKKHSDKDIQYILEQQASHITRNNYPKGILILKHKTTNELKPLHIYGKPD